MYTQEYGAACPSYLPHISPISPHISPVSPQEYGAACPQPNTRRVYISYVDSVKYFESSPPGHRSTVYRALLCAYTAAHRTYTSPTPPLYSPILPYISPTSPQVHAPLPRARLHTHPHLGGAALSLTLALSYP